MCQIIAQKDLFKQIILLLQLFTFAVTVYSEPTVKYPLPLGIVFEQGTPEVQTAFKDALLTYNSLNITSNPTDVYRFQAYVDTINTADAFKLSKLICNVFSRGIYAMIGSMNPESFHTYHAFANTFHMPIITPWYPSKGNKLTNPGNGNDLSNYATRLRPDFNQAVLDTIKHYEWKDIIYLYSTNEGLLRLQTLFYRSSNSDLLKVKLVKKIANAKDAIAILRDVESAERWQKKHILLDTPTALAKEIIIAHVRDVQLGRRTFHYLLPTLAFDEDWDSNVLEFNAVNITSFRMIDPNRRYVKKFLNKWASLDTNQFPGAGKPSISTNAALIHDSFLIIKESFTDILIDNPYAMQMKRLTMSACDSGIDFLDDVRPFEKGHLVNQHLRRVQTEGLTGNIQFHENGTRKYFSVDVVELRDNGTKLKIGQWSDFAGFRKEHPQHSSAQQDVNYKKVYVISSILEEPYLKMVKPVPGKPLTGNDMYEGYMKDLTDLIFSNLGLKYRIHLVRDGKYGTMIQTDYGESWNGIIGELIRNEVDLSISALSISSERERVVEFTKPFLSQGISIMAYKPKKVLPGMFSFLDPLSEFVWLSVLGAYFCVTGVLYIIYKLTVANHKQFLQRINDEYNSKYPNTPGQTFIQTPGIQLQEPELTLSNMFWMTFSILTHQQRTNGIIQRSIATKVASTAWWIFAIIIVSVYTGNYIAIKMRNRALTPIRSAFDLVDRPSISYGTLESGSTYDFFKNSENQVYRAMFEHISGPNQLNTRSYEDGISKVRQMRGKYLFLLESVKNDFVNNRKPCNTMKVGPKDLGEIHFGIGLPIGSPLSQKLNLEILKLRESGVLEKLEEKWWLNKAECTISTKLDEMESYQTDDELSLGSLAGIFYVLIIGMVVAILVSFCEFFCRSKQESRGKMTTAEAIVQRSVHPNTVIGSVPNDFRDIPTDLSSK